MMDEHMKGNEATNREKLSRDDKLLHSFLWHPFRMILQWLRNEKDGEKMQENSTPSSHKTDLEEELQDMMGEHMKGNEATNREKLSNEDVPLYDEIIQRKIRSVFEAYVIPRNVLHIFWKYDERVLVKKDIELIESEIKNVGPTAGAGKLLELLCKYENWIPCLIKVLCDSDVNQSHVAYKIVDILSCGPCHTQIDDVISAEVPDPTQDPELIAVVMKASGSSALLSDNNVQSEPSMCVSVQQLAEKDVLNARLETELDEIKREIKIERDGNAALKMDLKIERDRNSALEKEKVRAEETNQDKNRLIQELLEELEFLSSEKEKFLAEETNQDKNRQFQELIGELEKEKVQAEEIIQDKNRLIQELLEELAETGRYSPRFRNDATEKEKFLAEETNQDKYILFQELLEELDSYPGFFKTVHSGLKTMLRSD